ncbi:type II toxin-antitoxin system RelE/ParE family toxin [Nocardia cyriacigeorgica]|uniref:type II toxin-antitoxin system RelE/ParE family toxin n=1 Tax=Nocardia cyriacigeorgica TaxID=135487 RepID=UPI002453E368|nr:type II toxin-antitoxin system RelE/ParE family toxin [Nocardia cyriacigeorgica]
MIRSFKDSDAEAVWNLSYTKRINGQLAKKARDKMQLIDAADNINDLRVPPGNRLEKLSGGRRGQYSIRVNDQWRLCFRGDAGAHELELVDYR